MRTRTNERGRDSSSSFAPPSLPSPPTLNTRTQSDRDPASRAHTSYDPIMKLIKKQIEKDGSVSAGLVLVRSSSSARPRSDVTLDACFLPSPDDALELQGYVRMRPEDDEDMWHIYNLIAVVSAETGPTQEDDELKLTRSSSARSCSSLVDPG